MNYGTTNHGTMNHVTENIFRQIKIRALASDIREVHRQYEKDYSIAVDNVKRAFNGKVTVR